MIARELIRLLLSKADVLALGAFSAQGFGFLRYRINPNMRLHVWDSSLRTPGVSDIHDHTQWAFRSHIISGQLVNVVYDVGLSGDDYIECDGAIIQTGFGGGVKEAIETTRLYPRQPVLYLPGHSYYQEPDVLHRTVPSDGTVTIIEQFRRDCETARVFFPVGSKWMDAEPRTVNRDEVIRVCSRALELF